MRSQALAVSFTAFIILDLVLIVSMYFHGKMHLILTLKNAFS